jgi:hypothetical protein
MSQAALNNVLSQLASKDHACAALANELRLSRAALSQEAQRLETLAAKKQHFSAQTARLARLSNELAEAFNLSSASCAAAETSIQEKLAQSSATRVRRNTAHLEADDQGALLDSLVAEAQGAVAGVSQYCLLASS